MTMGQDSRSPERRAYEDENVGFKALAKRFPSAGTPADLRARARAEGWRQRRATDGTAAPEAYNRPGPPLGGGKIEITPEMILSYRGQCLTQRVLAARLGITDRTLRTRRSEDPAIDEAVHEVLERTVVRVDDLMLKRCTEGSDSMIRFVEATVGGLNERTRLEVTGADGQPIQHQAEVHGRVDVIARIAHFDLVLMTDGARTHAREEIEAAEQARALAATAGGDER